MNTDDEKRIRSFDGVEIAFSVAGEGSTSLLFIHGGLANRSFWKAQLSSLSDQYAAIAVDLAGHGASGRNRRNWSIDSFAKDIEAVAEALDLRRMVLIGNSLGGPVALKASALLRGRVIGVIGVDTLTDATQRITSVQARENADRFRADFARACRELAAMLFHPGREEKLRRWAESQMLAMTPAVVINMLEGYAGFDVGEAFRGAGTPIRVINGDLYPTKTDLNRTVVADFKAIIMKRAGHYPMLERPREFNAHLRKLVEELEKASQAIE